jgi:hypothetical protein
MHMQAEGGHGGDGSVGTFFPSGTLGSLQYATTDSCTEAENPLSCLFRLALSFLD